MPSAQRVQLNEHHLIETISNLTKSQKREVLDFAEFLAKRSKTTKVVKQSPFHPESLFDIATECKDSDLSTKLKAASPRRLSGLIGVAKGGFASPGEADAFLSRERDIWGS